MRTKMSDDFLFTKNEDGFEVLRPKKDGKTAHIQDLVINQRQKTKKRKAGRPGVCLSL